jgi:hypothetical protein
VVYHPVSSRMVLAFGSGLSQEVFNKVWLIAEYRLCGRLTPDVGSIQRSRWRRSTVGFAR